MRIRSIILAASIPLLILLAAVNGALLYYQSKDEMQRGLDERARAAAVTAAEFLSAADDPAGPLRTTPRRAALASAARHVDGLEGLYLVDAAGKGEALVPPKRDWTPAAAPPLAATEVAPLAKDAGGHRYVVARARVAGGGFVAARLDADPLFAQLDDLVGWIAAGIVVAGFVGLAAGWHVTRRIGRELAASRQVIAALDTGQVLPDTDMLTIAEAADLAAALRLLDANRRAALSGLDRRLAAEDRDRTGAIAFATWRRTLFRPLDTAASGARVAARLCGDAAPGCFFALCQGEGRAALVAGECTGETALDALAMAVAARRFLEHHWHGMEAGEALGFVRDAFAATRLAHLAWADADPPVRPRWLMIADEDTAAAAAIYAGADPAAAPVERLDGIEALLEPDGVFAIIGPA